MRQKPVIQRSTRRRRYKVVVDLLRERFGCTAAQCMPNVEEMLAENANLRRRVFELEQVPQAESA